MTANAAQDAAELPVLPEVLDTDMLDDPSGLATPEAQIQSESFELDMGVFDWESYIQGLDSDLHNAADNTFF